MSNTIIMPVFIPLSSPSPDPEGTIVFKTDLNHLEKVKEAIRLESETWNDYESSKWEDNNLFQIKNRLISIWTVIFSFIVS